MPTVWTNEEKLAGVASITYEQSGVTYNDVRYNYNGKSIPIWDTDDRNITTWTKETPNTTVWTKETKI